MTTPIRKHYEIRSAMDSDIKLHMPFLFDLACQRHHVRIIELGVRWGMSTSAFLAGAEISGGHVWSGDITEPCVPDEWWHSPAWTFVPGNDVENANRFPNDADVLFIDTSHTYEHTLKELELFVPKVKRNGVVLLHDTELPHVEGDPHDYPVRTALGDYCREHGLKFGEFPGDNGLGCIEKRAA